MISSTAGRCKAHYGRGLQAFGERFPWHFDKECNYTEKMGKKRWAWLLLLLMLLLVFEQHAMSDIGDLFGNQFGFEKVSMS